MNGIARFSRSCSVPDKYAEEGEDLKNATIPWADGKGAWRITEKDGIVTEIRAGLHPAIDLVEGG